MNVPPSHLGDAMPGTVTGTPAVAPPVSVQVEPPATWRVLVVNDEKLRHRLAAALQAAGQPAECHGLPSFLSAMGDLVQHQAHAILGQVATIPGMVSSTARALRRMAPQANLIALVEPGQEAAGQQAVQEGFNQYVAIPADAASLLQALGLSASDVQMTPEHYLDAHTGDVDLGDTDLVEAVLAGKGKLRATAMRLVRAQSGLAELDLAKQAEDTPAGYTHVPVTHLDEGFGVLHAPPPATAEQLTPWAGWLARWLMLDQRVGQLQSLSMRDELTGVWNRRYFNRFLKRILEKARSDRQQVTLMVFDIDDFKSYNDRYGHATGDEILSETARLMQSVVRDHDVVARIGGDEFAVIFWDHEGPRRAGSQHPQDVVNIARRFQHAICNHEFPKLLDEAQGSLTISGGLAGYPWDGQNPDDLLARADEMAMQSKRQGKNAIALGKGALEAFNAKP